MAEQDTRKCACGEPTYADKDVCAGHYLTVPGLTRVVNRIRQEPDGQSEKQESGGRP